MDDTSRITLGIPEPEDFDMGLPSVYIPVPTDVVGGLIDLLMCFLGHYRAEEGSEKDERVWDRLASSAAQALAGLLSAHGAYYHGDGTRELVEQIDRYCTWSDSPPNLHDPSRDRRLQAFAALRKDARTADIVDALEALHDTRARRREGRKQQRPAPEHDVAGEAPEAEERGWQF